MSSFSLKRANKEAFPWGYTFKSLLVGGEFFGEIAGNGIG